MPIYAMVYCTMYVITCPYKHRRAFVQVVNLIDEQLFDDVYAMEAL